jgi:hypothetical protein
LGLFYYNSTGRHNPEYLDLKREEHFCRAAQVRISRNTNTSQRNVSGNTEITPPIFSLFVNCTTPGHAIQRKIFMVVPKPLQEDIGVEVLE